MICNCHHQPDAKRVLQAVPEVSNEFNVVIRNDDLKTGLIIQEEVPIKD